jgi:hypothetical protein
MRKARRDWTHNKQLRKDDVQAGWAKATRRSRLIVYVHLVDNVELAGQEVEGADIRYGGGNAVDSLLAPLDVLGVAKVVPVEVGANSPVGDPVRGELNMEAVETKADDTTRVDLAAVQGVVDDEACKLELLDGVQETVPAMSQSTF